MGLLFRLRRWLKFLILTVMSRTFFAADTHFQHKNIIAYDNCPHATLEEHDEDIIRRWNKTVRDGDTVWFLGDLTLSHRCDVIEHFARKLRGRKRLIMGNHDSRPVDFYYKCGFERVYDYPVIVKKFFILSHKPVNLAPGMPFFNIYGHVHNHPKFETRTENSFCACLCRHDYKPVTLDIFDAYEVQEEE